MPGTYININIFIHTDLVHERGLADVGVARHEERARVRVERGEARQVLPDLGCVV